MGWRIFQLDVKSAFLNDYLEKNVYVEQAMSFFFIKGQEEKLLKLKKTLYGLKQAPRAWNRCIDKYFQDNGFVRCQHEYALYVKKFNNSEILLVCLYVDDIIFIENNQNLFEDFNKVMSCEFEMTDIRLMSYYLGLEVKQMNNDIFVSQESYAKVLEKFKMFDCNPVNTPMEGSLKLSRFDSGEKEDPTLFKSLVGSLRYLTSTRPDIMYAVGVVCYFMESPTSTHMKTSKRILHYLKDTLDFDLFYSSSKEFKLMGICDSDFVGDVNDRKGTTSFVVVLLLGTQKSKPLLHSTCEAEYVVATSCTCQAIWLRRLLKEFNNNQEESTKIHIDNKSTQVLAKNLVFHERSTHRDTRYHFIKECIVKKEVELVHVKTQDQVANIFIKSPKFEDFRRLRARLGIQNFLIMKGYIIFIYQTSLRVAIFSWTHCDFSLGDRFSKGAHFGMLPAHYTAYIKLLNSLWTWFVSYT
ncbi:hypothetical protein CR513_22662, partial [Mucuna pruriens]